MQVFVVIRCFVASSNQSRVNDTFTIQYHSFLDVELIQPSFPKASRSAHDSLILLLVRSGFAETPPTAWRVALATLR